MAVHNGTPVVRIPWDNAAQLKKVYEFLFSPELTKKKWAVETISVWETRCHPSLPTGVEATYVLTNAVIQDILWTNGTTFNHHTDLQGIYVSAITRFVSLFVEAYKGKDHFSYSSAKVAKLIGIPSFIVNIRNEGCHSNRPSLSLLRLSTQTALTYLEESYWKKEVFCANNNVIESTDKWKLFGLFRGFIKCHNNMLKAKSIESKDRPTKPHPDFIAVLTHLGKYLQKDKQLFVEVLALDDIFIPTDEDVKNMVSDEQRGVLCAGYNYEGDEDDEEEMDIDDAFNFESKNFVPVPQHHQNLWEPIIAMLNKHDCIHLFMETLLKSQGNRTNVGQKLLISWILLFLRIYNFSFTLKSLKLKKMFRKAGIVLNWDSLFFAAVVNPCKYIFLVLPLILTRVTVEKEVIDHVISMTALHLGFVKVGKKHSTKLFHTSQDLQNALESKRKAKSEPTVNNVFSTFPDDCHKLWPIGHIVNSLEEETVERVAKIFKCSSGLSFGEVAPEINKYEDEDDDETCKMNEEPSVDKLISDIDKKFTLLYTRSG